MTVAASEEDGFRCDNYGEIRVGAVLAGTYRVTGVIGAGGMGTVYEALHLRLGSTVAVKILRAPGDAQAKRRLLREARLTAGLPSDHLVRVTDCGTLTDDTPYVVMERLGGEDLRSLLAREGQLSVQRALRIALEICSGLTDLHAENIVHRDLKPANVFVLATAGGACRCKLLDLGIARSNDSDTTHSGAVVGSLRYMAPEQFSDPKHVAPHTDVYAAGVVLYQCLTGLPPHQGETPEEILFSILSRRPRAVVELRPEVSPDLSALVMRAVERDPQARPQSAADFARALSKFSASARETERSYGPLDSTLAEWTVPARIPWRRAHAWWLLALPVVVLSIRWGLTASSVKADTTHHVASGEPSRSPQRPSAPPITNDDSPRPNANPATGLTSKAVPPPISRNARPKIPNRPKLQPVTQSDLERNPYAE